LLKNKPGFKETVRLEFRKNTTIPKSDVLIIEHLLRLLKEFSKLCLRKSGLILNLQASSAQAVYDKRSKRLWTWKFFQRKAVAQL